MASSPGSRTFHAPTPDHQQLAGLLNWAQERGAVFPALDFDPANARHYLAAWDIPPLEPIIVLPQALLMHAANALQDPTFGRAFQQLRKEAEEGQLGEHGSKGGAGAPTAGDEGDAAVAAAASSRPDGRAGAQQQPASYWDAAGTALSERDLLCLLLVLERARGAGSRWAPYLDILPRQYDDPGWWPREYVEGLVRGTRVGRAVAAYEPGVKHLAAAMRRLQVRRMCVCA